MKYAFSQYPKILYQLIWLFLTSFFCLAWGTSDLAFFDKLSYEKYGHLNLNFSYGIIYFLFFLLIGYFIDKQKKIRKSIEVGVKLILIGFGISILFHFLNNFFQFKGVIMIYMSTLLTLFGCGFIFLSTIIHIGVLFPVANDWKDNAYSILFFAITFAFVLYYVFSEFIITSDNYVAQTLLQFYDTVYFQIGIKLSLGIFLWHLFNTYEHIGYEIQDDEIGETKEEKLERRKQRVLVSKKLIVLLTAFVLIYFIISNLPNLGNPPSYLSGLLDLINLFMGTSSFSMLIAFLIFLIIGYLLMNNIKFHATQFQKLLLIGFALILFGGMELMMPSLDSSFLNMILENLYGFIIFLLISPMVLSMVTHINLNQHIGKWIALFIILPRTFESLINKFVPLETQDYIPYLCFALLLLLVFILRENGKTWEEKLVLNEPNQIVKDNRNFDMIDHFLEK